MTAPFRRFLTFWGILMLATHAQASSAGKMFGPSEGQISPGSQWPVSVRKASPAASATIGVQKIEFGRWQIIAYFNGMYLVPTFRNWWSLQNTIVDVRPKITLSTQRIQGSAGCGGLEGAYQLHGDQLKITAGWLLAGWCPKVLEAQAHKVLNALNGKRIIVRDANHLLLKDVNGTIEVVLSR